jgi:hypothetical protein
VARENGLGVAPAAEVGACDCCGGAPVVELGGAAGFWEQDEEDLEVAVGDEVVEAREVGEEGVERLGGLEVQVSWVVGGGWRG